MEINLLRYFFYKIQSPSDSIPTFKFKNQIESSSFRNDSISSNKKIPVVFKYMVKTAKEVYLIGTFTNWKDKILMVKRFK